MFRGFSEKQCSRLLHWRRLRVYSLWFCAMKTSKNGLERTAIWPLTSFEQISSLSLLCSCAPCYISGKKTFCYSQDDINTQKPQRLLKGVSSQLFLCCVISVCETFLTCRRSLPQPVPNLSKASKVLAHYMTRGSKRIIRIIYNVSSPVLRERLTDSWEKAVTGSVHLVLPWKWHRGTSMNGNQAYVSFSLTMTVVKKQLAFIFSARTIKRWNAKRCYKLWAKNVFSIHS